MTPDNNADIKTRLQAGFTDAHISIEGDGYHYNITIISPVFAGKTTLQRHKMVYALLNERIASGALHAVILKTYTPEEQ